MLFISGPQVCEVNVQRRDWACLYLFYAAVLIVVRFTHCVFMCVTAIRLRLLATAQTTWGTGRLFRGTMPAASNTSPRVTTSCHVARLTWRIRTWWIWPQWLSTGPCSSHMAASRKLRIMVANAWDWLDDWTSPRHKPNDESSCNTALHLRQKYTQAQFTTQTESQRAGDIQRHGISVCISETGWGWAGGTWIRRGWRNANMQLSKDLLFPFSGEGFVGFLFNWRVSGQVAPSSLPSPPWFVEPFPQKWLLPPARPWCHQSVVWMWGAGTLADVHVIKVSLGAAWWGDGAMELWEARLEVWVMFS